MRRPAPGAAGFPAFPVVPNSSSTDPFDAIVIGSGFGGAFAARELVRAGLRVVMLERGRWVERGPLNWEADGAVLRTEAYAADSAYRVRQGRREAESRLITCVGGASVFYGGASLRFREADFTPAPELAGGVPWPVGYAEMAPCYDEVEALLGVAGEAGADPTEPPRGPYPAAPAAYAPISERIAAAARGLGLHPFPIPLNLGYDRGCTRCGTCDGFPCALGAKGDVAARLIPGLLAAGMELRVDAVASRLVVRGDAVEGVEYRDRATGDAVTLRGRAVVVAAGALATPHLLLASGVERMNPAGDAVGRYLVRHCNALRFGIFPTVPDPRGEHTKQVAVHDFYFGVDAPDAPAGKLGSVQQVPTPPPALLAGAFPAPVARAISPLVRRMAGLLCIAEDQPRAENGVSIDRAWTDRFGLPRMTVTHHYTARDLAARDALLRRAALILKRAGAVFGVTHTISTFSHAAGTVRMGDDPRTAPLDGEGRFRGLENLYVSDASCFPTSAGVNPSLTIAANALRIGRGLAQRLAAARAGEAG
jgi:choline dehydrogenase-like flavoprotein